MGIKKNLPEEQINKIKNSLLYLNLHEYAKEVYDFVIMNFNYFQSNMKNMQILSENSFILTSLDDSIFNVSLIPTCISPKSLVIKLNNLGGKFEQSFTINFTNGDENIIKIISKKTLSDENGDSKSLKKEMILINFSKFYEKSVQTSINNNDSYMKEINTYYYNQDDKYIKSEIKLSTESTFEPSKPSYEKYDGNKLKKISSTEFNRCMSEKCKNKVLQITRKVA